jgi:integrase
MPRVKSSSVPSYRRHRATGQAVVTLDGKDFYLGQHGTAASRAEYDRRIAEWTAAGRQLPADPDGITVAEMCSAFRRHAREFYKDADGTISRAVSNFDEAMKPLLKLYGKTPASEFGPVKLKTCREQFISAGRVRSNVNRLIVRLRGVFKWACENEMIPPSVFHGLMAVAGLRAGRSGARESEPIKPVPDEYVGAVRPHVSRQIWAMIELQRLCAARPGEIVQLRGIDIDMSGQIWVFRPAKHKTQIHGHKREIYLGPKARAIIEPFLKLDPQAYLFDPRDTDRERREALTKARRTPLSCGNRTGTNRTETPKRQLDCSYTRMSYYRAVIRGCDAAGIPRWHVNQLRHSRATELRKSFGIEGCQAVLGHSRVETSQIYAERLSETALKIAAAVG